MDGETRRAIEQDVARLVILYAALNDAARWEELAALYVEDGLMTRPTAPDDPIVGRAAILAAFRARPPRASRHVAANILVTALSADEAEAESVILLFTGAPADDGPPVRDPGPPLVGTFRDRLVRTEEGWRFRERRGALSFRP